MAVSPDTLNASFALIRGQGNAGLFGANNIHCQLAIEFSSGTPATPPVTEDTDTNTIGALFHTLGNDLNYAWRLIGTTDAILASTASFGFGFFIFPDNEDGNGAGDNRTQFINIDGAESSHSFPSSFPGPITLQAMESGSGAISSSVLASPGSYRIVPVIWNLSAQGTEDNNNPPDVNDVLQSGNEFYADSNYYHDFDASGSNVAFQSINFTRDGWIRVAADVQSLSTTLSSPLQSGQSGRFNFDVTASSLINAKRLRVGFVNPGDALTESLLKEKSNTPDINGEATTSKYVVNSQFSNDETYTPRLVVGPAAGETDTPANETPDIILSNTLSTGFPLVDQAWTVFGSVGTGLLLNSSYAVTVTGNDLSAEIDSCFNIHAGIQGHQIIFGVTGQNFKLNPAFQCVRKRHRNPALHLTNAKICVDVVTGSFTAIYSGTHFPVSGFNYLNSAHTLHITNISAVSGLRPHPDEDTAIPVTFLEMDQRDYVFVSMHQETSFL